jgi:two-component system, sensor histidine kinase
LSGGETGIQVIAALRDALGAQLKAVVTTGDTSSAIGKLARDPNLRIASKPINIDELLSLIEALRAV